MNPSTPSSKTVIAKFFTPELMPRLELKVVLPSTRSVLGTIYKCYQYSSHSGLHWHYCEDVSKDPRSVYGYVRLLYEVSKLSPMTYSDILKPVPPEPKNVVRGKISVSEFRDKLPYEYVEIVKKLLPETRNLLLINSEDGFSIYVYRPYDIKIPVIPFDNQANLYLYNILLPRHIIEAIMNNGTRRTLTLGNHTIIFYVKISRPDGGEEYMNTSAHVYENVMTTRRYNIHYAIVIPKTTTTMKIVHPEHGEKIVEVREPVLMVHIRELGEGE